MSISKALTHRHRLFVRQGLRSSVDSVDILQRADFISGVIFFQVHSTTHNHVNMKISVLKQNRVSRGCAKSRLA